MSKSSGTSLASRLTEQEKPAVSAVVEPERPQTKRDTQLQVRTDRSGQCIVSGWFPRRVKLELEELKIEKSRKLGRNVKLQEIMAEAYNDLFKKYGRAELADSVEE